MSRQRYNWQAAPATAGKSTEMEVRNAFIQGETMDIQRLRNLTTGILHTEISCVYADLEQITGASCLMTHMLPMALVAVEPWLREHVTDRRFWDGEYDPAHIGEYELPQPTADDMAAMFDRFKAQPNPLEDKLVVVVQP